VKIDIKDMSDLLETSKFGVKSGNLAISLWESIGINQMMSAINGIHCNCYFKRYLLLLIPNNENPF
jgi:hypothetical protein